VQQVATTELSADHRREVAAWIEKSLARQLPESVRAFLALHQKYLAAGPDVRRPFDSAVKELRRALGITPSSERRRSGNPLASIPGEKSAASATRDKRAWLEEQLARSARLSDWHGGLTGRHGDRNKRLKERLAKMCAQSPEGDKPITEQELIESMPLESFEPTEEQKARTAAQSREFCKHLLLGDGADPALQSVNETLMPGGAVLSDEENVSLPAVLPAEHAGATVVKELHETRDRYEFTVKVTRIALDVEKKVVVGADGARHVVAASTREYGPPRFAVTWSALATLAVLVGQFALPFNRLATMLSTATKRFTTGSLSRMLHYVAQRLAPIYLLLAEELADSEILSGDDTSCRVLEVSSYQNDSNGNGASSKEPKPPPWTDYQTPAAAEASFRRCEEMSRAREQRRAEGDRDAKRGPDETASLGVVVGRVLEFESPRRDGNGPKQSMHTTVVSGRSVADDPRSLIVFYRSHLGSFGNLLESLLRMRNRKARDVIVQGDLSSTNLVTSSDLLARFKVKLIGCSAHARRPFAIHEDEDRVYCEFMLHLFLGLAIHEQRLDVHGRNRKNVLAVRQAESRRIWEQIRDLAQEMMKKWSQGTKLGTAARYIVKNYPRLTAYLDDPRLEATNNMRERMLRMEKLIEGSSMFRRSLEGRFVLDVVRTVLQTAVAAGVPVHEYVESVLRANPDDVAQHPERFTPRAWAAANAAADAAAAEG
jgi:hypothetical protein